jgi:hypothetical protein
VEKTKKIKGRKKFTYEKSTTTEHLAYTRWNALLQKKCFKRTDVNYRGFQKTVKN